MITISNEDYKKAKRLLAVIERMPAKDLRDRENSRQAWLLLRKWKKREKCTIIASNFKDI